MAEQTITKILLRRGTEADRQSVILADGEPGWTTDTNKLYVGDGVTAGGVEVAPVADLVTGFDHLSANNLHAFTDSRITLHHPLSSNDTVSCDSVFCGSLTTDLAVTKGHVVSDPGSHSSIEIGMGQTSDNYAYIDLVGDTTYTDFGLRLIRNNTGANANSSLRHRGTGELDLVTVEQGDIRFITDNGNVRMMIDASNGGKVGIGTTTPNHELTVVGDISATGTIHGAGLSMKAYGIISEDGNHTLSNMSVNNPSAGVYTISTAAGLFPGGVCIPLCQSPGARSNDPNTYPPYMPPTVNSVSIGTNNAATITLWQQAGHFEDPNDEDNMYTFRFFNVGANTGGNQSIYLAVFGY